MRSLVVLLLLALVFLIGMVTGMERNLDSAATSAPMQEETARDTDKEVAKQTVNSRQIQAEQMVADSPVHLTQKAAIFLESLVKSFYNVTVEILYQLSRLFV